MFGVLSRVFNVKGCGYRVSEVRGFAVRGFGSDVQGFESFVVFTVRVFELWVFDDRGFEYMVSQFRVFRFVV